MLRCCHCGNYTVHEQVFAHEFSYRYADAEGCSMSEPAYYTGFSCVSCTDLSIYLKSPFHNPTSEYGNLIFPERPEDYEGLPKAIAEAYWEAMRVKRVSRPAFALMGRRLLEEVARDQGCSATNLAAALGKLSESGRLPPLLAKASTMIRVFGNVAAHDSSMALNEHHVAMIDEFLRLIIEYVYVAPSSLHTFEHLLEIVDAEDGDTLASEP